ncbi:MAG: AmmeMemoRadiSam system radical SAM enzyme [Desulfobacterales bacterium]|nr:AmmeMemoRadiSam system radical SAM enzyme [Desulfobacterales bacterium]
MEAYLYEKLENNKVSCNLCNHRCVINSGKRGKCNVRENKDGILETLVYGRIIADHVDPIEKKPLFHFLPGTFSYSISTVGCNFKCKFCQNSDIAQMPSDNKGLIEGRESTPEDVIEVAISKRCKSISYTYTEPTIYFEFAYDTAKLAKTKGLYNIFVTNGYMSSEALNMIAPYLDAVNVDLKAYTEEFYSKYCGAHIEPVKENLKMMKSRGIFVEVTTLIIPGLNDDKNELKALAEFIYNSLGSETPWHISRFHPTYKLTDRGSTPIDTLLIAHEIGIKTGLKYVYTGNVPGEIAENTFCYNCGELLIERWGFFVKKNFIENSRCPHCDTLIHGVGF